MVEQEELERPITATVDERGWTSCPRCDGSFKVNDPTSRLHRGRHGKCGQTLEFDGPGAHLAPTWTPPWSFAIPRPLWSFMRPYETLCVGACCGPCAFELDLGRSDDAPDRDPDLLARCRAQLDELIRTLESHERESVTSDMIDFSEMTVSEVVDWFGEWRRLLA